MAQLEHIQVKVAVDTTELDSAMKLARRLERDLRDLRTNLARAREELIGLDDRLEDHGIQLVLEDT